MNLLEEEQRNEKAWEEYLYPNSNVLRNKLNIEDYDELHKKEAEISFEKLVFLHDNPIVGNFDKKHLCDVHKYIFDELYEWAGKYRMVDMKKKDIFLHYGYIDKYLETELELMNKDILKVSSKDALACLLTRYLCELLFIHPFREGNGRCIREFLSEFVKAKSPNLPCGPLEIDWALMDYEEMNERIEFIRVYPSFYESQFMKALVPATLENNFQIHY